MPAFPEILTERLRLRALEHEDAPVVQRLAGDRRVADTTSLIPHPYPDGMAEAWIVSREAAWELGRGLVLAITLRATGGLIGAIGLGLDPESRVAEMGYWVGVPYWGCGYATEAARAMVAHGFTHLGLERIHAHHFARNPASGRVLQKAGLLPEGVRVAAITKWGRPEDAVCYGVSRAEWEQGRAGS